MKPRQAILIVTDTQGANTIGCYGSPLNLSPNIDDFAARGQRFNRAYTTCPLCTPARSALFTGFPSHANGAWSLELSIGRAIPSLPERLSGTDIVPAYIGKWHLSGTDYFDIGEPTHGWSSEVWFDGRNHVESLDYETRSFVRNIHTPEEIRDFGLKREDTFAAGCTDRAEEFLRRHKNDDFLLVVSYDEPHAPAISPPPFCDEFGNEGLPLGPSIADDLADKPRAQRSWQEDPGLQMPAHARLHEGRYFDQPYFACNKFVDEEIGRVLSAINTQTPEALTIFTSDHGEMLGAHNLHKKGPAMYEEQMRVPLILAYPGMSNRGDVSETPVSHLDVLPTLLSWFNLPKSLRLSGESLFSVTGEKRAVFMEFNRFSPFNEGRGGFRPIRAIFDGRFKFAVNLFDMDELYDLHQDPAELENRIEDKSLKAVRERLHRHLMKMMTDSRDPFRGPEWIYRPYANYMGEYRWPSGLTPRRRDIKEKPIINYATGAEQEDL